MTCRPWLESELETIHPSAILRRQDEESRQSEFAAFVDDLSVVARVLGATAARR